MTDTERERINAICEVAGVAEIDDLSDGFHTFRQLYYQRMMLFATIVKQNKDKAWKSLRHEEGELCFGGGWFVVGIDTPEGNYTYHYENKYFDLFDCEILDYGKHWDGHTEKDVTRLLSLPPVQSEKETPKRVLWSGWKGMRDTRYKCPNCKKPVRNTDIYCHRCGQKLMFPNISFTPYVEGQKQELIVRWDDE